MDVAAAMAGVPIQLRMPQIVRVYLTGQLKPGVNAKDVVLEMLRRETIRGGYGKIYEYAGPGAAALEVPQRATIANMGAEMGATTSIFPADEQVRRFLKAQDREDDFRELLPDGDAPYDQTIELDLSRIEPLAACPHQPDRVLPLTEVPKKRVQQVFIGSCTNASYGDIAKAATVFRGRRVHDDVSCTCAIASRQTYKELLRDGYLDLLVDAGVRLLEISCGPCCAIGQVPPTNGVAVRTSNRNFKGRAGEATAEIYLVSPESAAATAIRGTFSTAGEIMGEEIEQLGLIVEPERYAVDDAMILPPLTQAEAEEVELLRGPNIKPLPIPDVPERDLAAAVSLKAGDNISTDDITPAGAELSSMRSNIPLMSRYCYARYDPGFAERARELGASVIVGGENYGQGSSREHAAINPMYLGVKCVIAKSIARIHRSNLVNHGVIPLLFADPADYDGIDQMDMLEFVDLPDQMSARRMTVRNLTKHISFDVVLDLTDHELEILKAGGRLRYLKKQLAATP